LVNIPLGFVLARICSIGWEVWDDEVEGEERGGDDDCKETGEEGGEIEESVLVLVRVVERLSKEDRNEGGEEGEGEGEDG
jgi:hypothetical protein